MEQYNRQIDKIIKEKFEHFAPEPPESVWQGIEASLNAPRSGGLFSGTGKRWLYGVAAIVVALVGWLLLGKLQNSLSNNDVPESVSVSLKNRNLSPQNGDNAQNVNGTAEFRDKESGGGPTAGAADAQEVNRKNGSDIVRGENNPSGKTPVRITGGGNSKKQSGLFNYTGTLNINDGQTVFAFQQKRIDGIQSKAFPGTVSGGAYGSLLAAPAWDFTSVASNAESLSRWRAGFFVSPEFTVNSLDSLRVLQAYSLNADFRYTAENGLFISFGAGAQYARDRFFVHVKFKSWDFLGSYDDVYDVTFDTTSGKPVPIYHTHKVDVYDSILHVNVSESTRRYVYLQMPLLAGYSGKLSERWNAYVYGGPAVNIMVSQWMDYPQTPGTAGPVYYQTNAYQRNKPVYQLWLGAGFEYLLNRNLHFVLEPGYRYYFNPVYKDFYKKQSLSAFTLRLGLTFKL